MPAATAAAAIAVPHIGPIGATGIGAAPYCIIGGIGAVFRPAIIVLKIAIFEGVFFEVAVCEFLMRFPAYFSHGRPRVPCQPAAAPRGRSSMRSWALFSLDKTAYTTASATSSGVSGSNFRAFTAAITAG